MPRFQRQWPLTAKSKIAHAAVYEVLLDIQPLSFCDRHEDMWIFANYIFEMGQSVSENEKIDPFGYLPGRTSVTNVVRDTNNNLRTKFVAEKKDGRL